MGGAGATRGGTAGGNRWPGPGGTRIGGGGACTRSDGPGTVPAVELDARTLIFSAGATALCILTIQVVVRTARTVPAGFGAWTLSQLGLTVGAALISARGALPDWASIVAGNLLVICGFALVSVGFARFYGVIPRPLAWLDAAVVLAAVVLITAWARGPVNRRIITFSLACAWFLARTALEPLASAEARRSAAQRVVTVLNLAGAGLLLIRVGWAAWAAPYTDLLHEGWTAIVPGLLLTAVNVTTMFITLFLCFERSELQLRRARSEVKTLSGLLPICMQCHKIRNDQGYWDRLERFIAERSEARFTHGLCPDCYRDMFPGEHAEPAKKQA